MTQTEYQDAIKKLAESFLESCLHGNFSSPDMILDIVWNDLYEQSERLCEGGFQGAIQKSRRDEDEAEYFHQRTE